MGLEPLGGADAVDEAGDGGSEALFVGDEGGVAGHGAGKGLEAGGGGAELLCLCLQAGQLGGLLLGEGGAGAAHVGPLQADLETEDVDLHVQPVDLVVQLEELFSLLFQCLCHGVCGGG